MTRNALIGRALAGLLGALVLTGCGSDSGSDPGTGGMAGVAGTAGTAGTAGAAGSAGAAGAGSGGQTGSGGSVATSSLEDDLTFLREEEKLARDVYLTLYDQWQLMPHKNIASSEQTHTDRVKDMLASFGFADPVKDDTVGVFVNTDLAKLYTDLTQAGKQSEVESLKVGATIEDLDIRDIEVMKARTSDANVLAMYDALQCGSRNHLRSFNSQLVSKGASYSPQYISQAEFDAIVGSANEKCN